MDLTTVGFVIIVVGGVLFIGFLLKQINPSWSNNRSSNAPWNSPPWFSSNSQTFQNNDQTGAALGQQWDSSSAADSGTNVTSCDLASSYDQSSTSDSGSASSCDCSSSDSGSASSCDCSSSDSGSSDCSSQ